MWAVGNRLQNRRGPQNGKQLVKTTPNLGGRKTLARSNGGTKNRKRGASITCARVGKIPQSCAGSKMFMGGKKDLPAHLKKGEREA